MTSDRTNPAQITDRGLDVELVGTSRELHDIAGGIDQLHDDIAATTASVDDIDARVARLTGQAPTIAPREIEAARVQLQSRHVSAETADLAALLDPVEIDRIRRRYSGDHMVRARLDGIDVLVALSAGVAATVVDAIITATPATSPVTNWLRSHAVDSDNWLADLAHVPYDAVNGTGIDGMSALTHRVQTLGHDPLLGLIVGTVDIMRGNPPASPPAAVSVSSTVVPPLPKPGRLRSPPKFYTCCLMSRHLQGSHYPDGQRRGSSRRGTPDCRPPRWPEPCSCGATTAGTSWRWQRLGQPSSSCVGATGGSAS